MTDKIGILGAGGQADEVTSFLRDTEIAFYAISEAYVDTSNEKQIDIAKPNEEQKLTPVIVAIGAPEVRRSMAAQWSGAAFTSVQSDASYIDKTAVIDAGCIIAPGAIITTNVHIGAHSIVNVGATISHDSKIGDFVTIGPGAHLGGHVVLGDGVFVGIGASISNDIKIAKGSVIGAGAVVIKDVLVENSVVVGIPAKVIKQNEGWLREI
ncbi:MAG: hypothetical protein ABIP50_00830 [Candidatus Saccharimonadales bacterium]